MLRLNIIYSGSQRACWPIRRHYQACSVLLDRKLSTSTVEMVPAAARGAQLELNLLLWRRLRAHWSPETVDQTFLRFPLLDGRAGAFPVRAEQ